jgi:hypothetical protein
MKQTTTITIPRAAFDGRVGAILGRCLGAGWGMGVWVYLPEHEVRRLQAHGWEYWEVARTVHAVLGEMLDAPLGPYDTLLTPPIPGRESPGSRPATRRKRRKTHGD